MEVMEKKEPQPGWTEALGGHSANPDKPRRGYTVQSIGDVWNFSSCENRIKSQFEDWVRDNARSEPGRLEKRAAAENDASLQKEADALRATFVAQLSAGHYNWEGKHCREARGDLPGIYLLAFLLLRRCHPDITEEKAAAVFDGNTKDCFAAMGWALGNSISPTQGRAGETKAETR